MTDFEPLGRRRDVSARADRVTSGCNARDWLRQLANLGAAVGQIAAAWYVVRARSDQFTQPFAGGSLVSWMLTGESVEGRIAFRKGGACLLEFDHQPRMGKARLIWSLPPSVLRRVTG